MKPIKPKEPLLRVIREGDIHICKLCGCDIKTKWFGLKKLGCRNTACEDYYDKKNLSCCSVKAPVYCMNCKYCDNTIIKFCHDKCKKSVIITRHTKSSYYQSECEELYNNYLEPRIANENNNCKYYEEKEKPQEKAILEKNDENLIEQLGCVISDCYYDKIGYSVSFCEMKKESQEKYKTKWCLNIWFDDMFDWAFSDVRTFICQNQNDLAMVFAHFDDWYDSKGKQIFDKFKEIPYPPKDYNAKQLEDYFSGNRKIRDELSQVLNEHCGFDSNEVFEVKNVKEDNS